MKQKSRNSLATAQMLFVRKKYGQVISLLLPQIVLYRKDPFFHEILGFSCLHTGDFGGASSYFKRSLDLDSQRISVLLGSAIVMLRRRKLTEAITIWLNVLDLAPRNTQAIRALNMAKVFSEDDWFSFIEEGRYSTILLNRRHFFHIRTLLGILLFFGILGVTLFILYQREDPYRENVELLEFNEAEYTQGDYSQFASLIFTEQELEKKLNEVQRYYRRFKDNLVRYHGNQVLMSNAPLLVKDRVSFILTQLLTPDFTDFQNNFDYEEVSVSPELFHGVYVRWRGRIANLVISEELIAFDLLVGFDTGRIVQGTVAVLLDFAVKLEGGESIELIGQINNEDGVLGLSGTSVRLIHNDDLSN